MRLVDTLHTISKIMEGFFNQLWNIIVQRKLWKQQFSALDWYIPYLTDLKMYYGLWSNLRSTFKAKIAFSDYPGDLSIFIGRLNIFQIFRF